MGTGFNDMQLEGKYHSVGKDCPFSLNWAPQRPEIIIKGKKYGKVM
jgi:hypothetical protein